MVGSEARDARWHSAGPEGKLGTDLEAVAPWGYSDGFLLLLLAVG